jgi:bacterioferritin (cytochrome b1)
MGKIDEKIDMYLNEAVSGQLASQLRAAQKRADDAFKEGVRNTLKAMDEYAKETCVDLYKGDIQKQSECFASFYAKLIIFVQDQFQPYMSDALVNELVSDMDEHAKTLRKKYGWYGK